MKQIKKFIQKEKENEVTVRELSIQNRLAIIGVLPERGSIKTMTVRESIVKKIQISVDEFQQLKIGVLENGNLTIPKESVDYKIKVGFLQIEVDQITKQLKELAAKEELDSSSFSLLPLFSIE